MILHIDSMTGNLMIDENTDHYPYIYLGTFITELNCLQSKQIINKTQINSDTIIHYGINGISYRVPFNDNLSIYPEINAKFCPTLVTGTVGNPKDQTVALIVVGDGNKRSCRETTVGQLVSLYISIN